MNGRPQSSQLTVAATAFFRKLNLARTLIRSGDWRSVAAKSRRNIVLFLSNVREVFTAGRDWFVWNPVRRKRIQQHPVSLAQRRVKQAHFSETSIRKNVVWIMLDALRSDMFQYYLHAGGLANLKATSLNFPRAFAQGSWTYPSVFSFLTGMYPFNCGVSWIVRENGYMVSRCQDFDDQLPTVFRILRNQGYRVGSILDGWGYTVRTTAGQRHREDGYFEDEWGWFYGQRSRFLSLKDTSSATTDFICSGPGSEPFMLFVRSLYTHSPYRGIFQSSERVTDLSRKDRRSRLIGGFVRGLAQFERICLDSVIQCLRRIRQLDRTILIISSDHGDMLWNVEDDMRKDTTDEEVWRHQLEPYSALTKVPLLLWGTALRGQHTAPFRLVDLVPTLLEELGIAYQPTEFDGISIRRYGPRPLYADSAGSGYGGIAYQDGGEKLLMSSRLGIVSYAITPDEYEHHSLRKGGGSAFSEFRGFLRDHSRHSNLIEQDDGTKALERRLRSLGYIE